MFGYYSTIDGSKPDGYSPFPYNKGRIAVNPAHDKAGIPMGVTLPICIN